MMHVLGHIRSAFVIALASLSGCVLWMRDEEFYTQELTELLETRTEKIEACYERVLEQDTKVAGDLVVSFDVEKDSGIVTNAEIVTDQTTLPEPVSACVIVELLQLRLEKPDYNDAHATFRWTFTPGSRKPTPVDPFHDSQAAVLGCYSTHLATVDRTAQGVLVIDYAFDREQGTIDQLHVVAEGTTAPAPVVECAKQALQAAKVEPGDLDNRNATGRRAFTLRFTPFAG